MSNSSKHSVRGFLDISFTHSPVTNPSVGSAHPPSHFINDSNSDNAVADTSLIFPSKLNTLTVKKTGKPIKPALKPSHSAPNIRRLPKYVHFDPLDHIRHFSKSQTPSLLEVSLDACEETSENIESEKEGDELTIEMPNITPAVYRASSQPICLVQVVLSPDNHSLLGELAESSQATKKEVSVVYTFDFWHTVNETEAHSGKKGRYNFEIKLPAGQEVTMFFAVRLRINGKREEYWDNCDGMNYQMDIRRKRAKKSSAKPPPIDTSKPSVVTTEDPTSPPIQKGNFLRKSYDIDASLDLAIQNASESHSTLSSNMENPLRPSLSRFNSFPPPLHQKHESEKLQSEVTRHAPPLRAESNSNLTSSEYEELINRYCYYQPSSDSSPNSNFSFFKLNHDYLNSLPHDTLLG
ncbi:uncharacterized protein VTP21DRAFT_7284 [Calcarisporiella thermophila]|uniref:uncharacterized protein n=1 Tax=Calcarisporiella thermophila TaxID=911321 RepID=UPI0037430714